MYSRGMMMGPGPYERQTRESEVTRPLVVTLMRCGVYIIIAVLVCAEAFIIGQWAGPLCFAAFAVMALNVRIQNTGDGISARVKWSGRGRWTLCILACGVLFSVLLLCGAWPVYWTIGDGRLWIAVPWMSFSVSIHWLWARAVALALLPAFVWLCLTLDKRLRGEVIAPNWYNSFRARPANATGDIAQSLGMYYPQGVDDEIPAPYTAAPNPPVN